ncbi:sulfatase [Spirosoma panaciterrae]|uniref:sulfatase n=1 Tax=Spirosoma panaciterrae TaxID=496058 RepID=UPI001FDF25A6|nr:sulfatase [Spirosoma panaciterrae]
MAFSSTKRIGVRLVMRQWRHSGQRFIRWVLPVGSVLLVAFMTRMNSLPKQPNIIVFLVDDMGWQDTSVPFWTEATAFNKRYHTPNMERLAREGMKFTNAYANPVCTPTRVSLLTGMNATRHRVTNWTSPNRNTNTDYPDSSLSPVNWNLNGLSPVADVEHTVYATPLPAILSDNGYYTIHCGKAHFGSAGTPGSNPTNLGFRVNIAGSEIGHPASYLGTDNYDRPVNGKPSRNAVPGLDLYHGTDTFLTEALTKEALKALEAPLKQQQPFFLYMAHYAVHTPIMADKRFVDKYHQMGLDGTEANYASLVEGMDKSLGDILQFLDDHKLTDNTIILFMSDNGGLSTTPLRGGQAHTHNLPLRAGKGSVYEGGIREPMLVRWPGVVKAGSTASQYVLIDDFFPTILQIASVKSPKLIQPVDGRSFLPILRKSTWSDPSRMLVWHHPNRWIAQEGPALAWASACRQGDWKLVYQHKTGQLELYNLKNDIGEQHNVAAQEPQQLKRLTTLFTNELQKMGAQMPTFTHNGQAVRWPSEVLSRQLSSGR